MLPKGFSRSQFPEVPRSCQNALFWLCAEASPTSVPATALKFLFRPAIPIFNLNGLVHRVFADRAPTCQAAVAEEPSSQVPRLEFGSVITIRQRQWTLVAAINSIQDFGHCRSPRAVSPTRRSPRARRHL